MPPALRSNSEDPRLAAARRSERMFASLSVGVFLALVFLPGLVFIRAFQDYRASSETSRDIALVLATPDVNARFEYLLRIASSDSVARAEQPVAGDDDSHTLVFFAPAFPSSSPSDHSLGCSNTRFYGRKLVAFDAVSFTLDDSSDGETRRFAEHLLESSEIPRALRSTYDYLLSALQPRSSPLELSTSNVVPPVPFVYVAFPFRHTTLTVFYPAVSVPATYVARERPWYQAATSPRIPPALLDVTHPYFDFTTNLPVLSILAATRNDTGDPTFAVADIRLRTAADHFYALLFNLLLCSIAFVLLSRYKALPFPRYVRGGAGLLVLLYSALLVAWVLSPTPDDTIRDVTRWVEPFVPTATLSILAARALRTKRVHPFWKEFRFWYGLQILVAIISVASRQPALDDAFDFCALTYLGLAFWHIRDKYEDLSLSELRPHPRHLASFACLAHMVWALVQFSALFFFFDSALVRPCVQWLELSAPPELVFLTQDVSGTFLLLLAAKGIAYLFTITFLGADESAMLVRERVGDSPSLTLNRDGTILAARRWPYPTSLRGRATLFDLLADAEDCDELRQSLRDCLPLHSYVCHLSSGLDPTSSPRLVSLEVKTWREHLGVPQLRVLVRFLDADAFRFQVQIAVRREVEQLLERLAQHSSDIDLDTDTHRMQNNLASLATSEAFSTLKSDGQVIAATFLESARSLAPSCIQSDKLTIHLSPAIGNLRVRIAPRVFDYCLDSIIAEVRASLMTLSTDRRTLSAAVAVSHERPGLLMRLTLPIEAGLRRIDGMSRQDSIGQTSPWDVPTSNGGRLAVARYLLKQFGNDLEVRTDSDSSTVLTIACVGLRARTP